MIEKKNKKSNHKLKGEKGNPFRVQAISAQEDIYALFAFSFFCMSKRRDIKLTQCCWS